MNDCDELCIKVEAQQSGNLMRAIEALFAKSGWGWAPGESRESAGYWMFKLRNERGSEMYSVVVEAIDAETFCVATVIGLGAEPLLPTEAYNFAVRAFQNQLLNGLQLPFPILMWLREGAGAEDLTTDCADSRRFEP